MIWLPRGSHDASRSRCVTFSSRLRRVSSSDQLHLLLVAVGVRAGPLARRLRVRSLPHSFLPAVEHTPRPCTSLSAAGYSSDLLHGSCLLANEDRCFAQTETPADVVLSQALFPDDATVGWRRNPNSPPVAHAVMRVLSNQLSSQ